MDLRKGLFVGAILGTMIVLLASAPAAAGPPFDFRSVAPCRLLDTRQVGPQTNGLALTNPGPYTFRVQGNCGVPNGAVAAVMNISVIAPTQAGYLLVWPAGTAQPTVASISYPAGISALSNGATVPLSAVVVSTDKDISVVIGMGTSGSLHLAIDLTGYFQ